MTSHVLVFQLSLARDVCSMLKGSPPVLLPSLVWSLLMDHSIVGSFHIET